MRNRGYCRANPSLCCRRCVGQCQSMCTITNSILESGEHAEWGILQSQPISLLSEAHWPVSEYVHCCWQSPPLVCWLFSKPLVGSAINTHCCPCAPCSDSLPCPCQAWAVCLDGRCHLHFLTWPISISKLLVSYQYTVLSLLTLFWLPAVPLPDFGHLSGSWWRSHDHWYANPLIHPVCDWFHHKHLKCHQPYWCRCGQLDL